MKKPRGVFVTGTDTDIGKTFVSSLVLEALVCRGVKPGVMKPYASGSWSDATLLKRQAGLGEPLRKITPAYFSEPLAPAAHKFIKINRNKGKANTLNGAWKRVLLSYRSWTQAYPFVLVEGIGGVLVPLDLRHTVADLIKKMNLPVWLVAGSQLGTLNHTLLSVRCLQSRGISIARIVLNRHQGRSQLERSNRSLLERLTGIPLLPLPRIRTGRQKKKFMKQLDLCMAQDFKGVTFS